MAFGTIFARTGQLWMPIFAHAAFDVTAVAIIYEDAESAIAHLVFK
ncbi:MAG: CPBP family glutamic-type intramembrane protease [Myxococcales bacterium]